MGVPYYGVLIIRILLFKLGYHIRAPYFRKLPYSTYVGGDAPEGSRRSAYDCFVNIVAVVASIGVPRRRRRRRPRPGC